MAKYIALKNPPIRECVLSLRFRDEVSSTIIEQLINDPLIKSVYSKRSLGYSIEVEERSEQSNNLSARRSLEGYILSSDNNTAIRARLDSLSYHQVRAYTTFEKLYGDFENICAISQKYFSPYLNQISLRYINEIQKTFIEGDIKDYVTLYPSYEMGEQLKSFFIQIKIENTSDKSLTGIINEALRNDSTADSLVIDIVVYKDVDYESSQGTKLKEDFYSMREFKNDLFFKIISDELKNNLNK